MPVTRDELPDTLKRSPKHAQDIYLETLESAHEQYDSEEQAHRTAFAALKHSYEKVGDHWEAKDRTGPSDPRSEGTTAQKRAGVGATAGGVDVEGHTRDELYERARRLDIKGRSRMTKLELGQAIARAQD
jgi:cation transport regulator ChaB